MARSPEGATTDVLSLPGSWTEAFRDVVPWLAASVRELGGPG